MGIKAMQWLRHAPQTSLQISEHGKLHRGNLFKI